MLFIIIHQTKELWLKQMIHELRLALGLVRADKLIEVHKNLSRVSRIQAVMTLVVGRAGDADFRPTISPFAACSALRAASSPPSSRARGSCSASKKAPISNIRAEGSAAQAALAAALAAPSLWDEANRALARAGFDVPAADRDWSQPYQPNEKVEGGLGDGLSRHDALVALLPVRRETGRRRRRARGLAAQACGDRRAGDRAQARHRRHRRRALSSVDPRQARLPRIVDAQDEIVAACAPG